MNSQNKDKKNNPVPLVSIIVPMYNVENYIEECLDSILLQNHKNLEIIVVNDGSPDSCGKIADEYAMKDSRVHVIHQENKGVSAARNHGLEIATGDFIVFIDADDWVSADHVSYLLKIYKKTGADLCFSTSLFSQKDEEQNRRDKIRIITPQSATALLLSPKVVVGSYNKLYHKNLLLGKGLRFSEELFSGEGLCFITNAAQHAESVGIGNRKTYYYRRNVASSATTKFNVKMYTNNEYSLDLIKKNLIKSNDEVLLMHDLFMVHLCISGLMALYQNSAVKEYPQELKRWKEKIRAIAPKLLFSGKVSVKSKIRIIGALTVPKVWALLAKKKRERIFNNSVDKFADGDREALP
ncbi:glycosyl transferase family 2 [Clostridia bacterium]|nr:glycosyl transferase family 2 [Clostridia bacterium]